MGAEKHEGNGKASAAEPATADDLATIAAALQGLRYGQVTITVHDGAIVQVERTERRRFGKP